MEINNKEKWLLLKTVQEENILPLTSVCNMSCLFCSHQHNPPEINTYNFGHLDFELIQELSEYISADNPLVIGESATKIIEGEPLIHPDFRKIMTFIRKKFPRKKFIIATSGNLLDSKMVNFLNSIKPLKLNISVNCASPTARKYLMKDSNPEQVFQGLKLIAKNNISFNGSMVAMPHLLGWESIEKTVKILNDYSPETIRIFVPGFTKYSDIDLKFDKSLFPKLKKYINKLNETYSIPLTMEPPFLKNFQCKVKGVIDGSPAARTEIKKFDIIKKINNISPGTRVGAFNRLVQLKSPELVIKRKNKEIKFTLDKDNNTKPGIVMDYDLNPIKIDQIEKIINKNFSKKIVIVTSRLSENLLKKIVEKIRKNFSVKEINLVTAENKFFGGTIMCTGLLVVSDIIKALKNNNYHDKDLLILPGSMFDPYGKDLRGKSYQKIKEFNNMDIEIIN